MRRLKVELAALYVVAPVGVALAPAWAVLPAILAGSAMCLALLMTDPTFDRRTLWRGPQPTHRMRPAVYRSCVAAAAIFICVLALARPHLLSLPRQRPGLWATVVLGYPCLSVYPQEIIFRAFFFHRYAPLFRGARGCVLPSAVAFSFSHIVLHNAFAVVATAAAGLVLASVFARDRSTLAVSIEHALWGCLAFTLGLGHLFYAGAR